MRPKNLTPSGREARFDDNDIIVSKTDIRGVITYANSIFQKISGYAEEELLGQPHNILRHPDMPRCVFRLLWDTIQSGEEIFAYVLNLCKNGDHYWVLAHVTPSYDLTGNLVGYHSNRRVPYPDAIDRVHGLYAQLLNEERRHANPKAAAEAGVQLLHRILREKQLTYGQFVFSLSEHTRLGGTRVHAHTIVGG